MGHQLVRRSGNGTTAGEEVREWDTSWGEGLGIGHQLVRRSGNGTPAGEEVREWAYHEDITGYQCVPYFSTWLCQLQ